MLRYFRPGFFAAGLAARLIGSNSASLWLDEAISKYRASVGPATYFTDLSRYTGTNLWEILLMPFANGPVWLLRLPALISSMLGLWLAWRIMDRLAFTQSQRLTAAVPWALLPGLLW